MSSFYFFMHPKSTEYEKVSQNENNDITEKMDILNDSIQINQKYYRKTLLQNNNRYRSKKIGLLRILSRTEIPLTISNEQSDNFRRSTLYEIEFHRRKSFTFITGMQKYRMWPIIIKSVRFDEEISADSYARTSGWLRCPSPPQLEHAGSKKPTTRAWISHFNDITAKNHQWPFRLDRKSSKIRRGNADFVRFSRTCGKSAVDP